MEGRVMETPAQRQARMAGHYAQTLACFNARELGALQRLYELPKRHIGTSGGNAAAKLLLGLYNGRRFPFDLTDLRVFDDTNFECAIAVLRMDAPRCRAEVHTVIDAIYADGIYTGHEFENWAWNLRLKGRCTKDNLPTGPFRQLELREVSYAD
jgi:hypothetical protein